MTTVPLNDDEQQPVRRSLCRSVRKNFHWKCFLLTVFIDGCLVYIFLCHDSYTQPYAPQLNSKYSPQAGPCSQGYNFIPVAFGVMLYVVYIMECWHSKIRTDLICKSDSSSVMDHINAMRAAAPVVWWRAVCYHYVRRTRQVTRYRNGDAVTTTQVYYERINSHTAGTVFLYHECGVKDISKKLVKLSHYPVTKIRFSKGFVFANIQAANEFEDQRTRFFQENEMRDDYMEVREGLDLSDCGFKEFMISFSEPNTRPWYCTQLAFWVLSAVLMSWPLRVLIESRTAYVHYQVTKLFGTNYLSPSSQNYTGPLTRVSTIDSSTFRELEQAASRTGYVIVPSYSEALLMDPVIVTDTNRITYDTSGHPRVQRNGQPATNDTSNDALCNQMVIANYGALTSDMPHPPRSQSLNVFRIGTNRSRSISIGSLSRAYHTLPSTPDEEPMSEPAPRMPVSATLLGRFTDAPPPYELAVRMCARLRQSAQSIRALWHAGNQTSRGWHLADGTAASAGSSSFKTEMGEEAESLQEDGEPRETQPPKHGDTLL